MISVCDREGDFRDLLALAGDKGIALLVRAQPFGEAAGADARRQGGVPVGACRRAAARRGVGADDSGRRRPPRPQGARRPPGDPPYGGRVAAAASGTAARRRCPCSPSRPRRPGPPTATNPLHWLLLTTERPAEGQAAAVHAATVLDWYRKRWDH